MMYMIQITLYCWGMEQAPDVERPDEAALEELSFLLEMAMSQAAGGYFQYVYVRRIEVGVWSLLDDTAH